MATKPEPSKTHPRPGTPGAAATPSEACAERSPHMTPEERARLAREASRQEDA